MPGHGLGRIFVPHRFLRSLTARGLAGVRLVISDAHRGLVDAIAAALPGAAWQRCRTHYLRNLLTKVPRSAQSWVATMVRTIFRPTRRRSGAGPVRPGGGGDRGTFP